MVGKGVVDMIMVVGVGGAEVKGRDQNSRNCDSRRKEMEETEKDIAWIIVSRF